MLSMPTSSANCFQFGVDLCHFPNFKTKCNKNDLLLLVMKYNKYNLTEMNSGNRCYFPHTKKEEST